MSFLLQNGMKTLGKFGWKAWRNKSNAMCLCKKLRFLKIAETYKLQTGAFFFSNLELIEPSQNLKRKKILFKNIGIIWWSVKSSVGDCSFSIYQFLNEWNSRKLELLLVAETNREKGEPGCWGNWKMATHKGGKRVKFAFHNQMKITRNSGHRCFTWISCITCICCTNFTTEISHRLIS